MYSIDFKFFLCFIKNLTFLFFLRSMKLVSFSPFSPKCILHSLPCHTILFAFQEFLSSENQDLQARLRQSEADKDDLLAEKGHLIGELAVLQRGAQSQVVDAPLEALPRDDVDGARRQAGILDDLGEFQRGDAGGLGELAEAMPGGVRDAAELSGGERGEIEEDEGEVGIGEQEVGGAEGLGGVVATQPVESGAFLGREGGGGLALLGGGDEGDAEGVAM